MESLPLAAGRGSFAANFRVPAIEHHAPRALRVLRLPELAHGSVDVRRPGDALLRSLEHHVFAIPAAFERQQQSVAVHPGLVPHLARSIVDIEAFTAVTL